MAKIASRSVVHDTFLGRNGLTLAFIALMALSMLGHMLTGWHTNNQEREAHGQPPEALSEYLGDGHFLGTLFENWESEFLQMGLFVLLTAVLRQKGAAESRPLDPAEEPAADPAPLGQRPWPARRGGAWRKVYEHSLSGVLLLMFIASFFAHLYFSWKHHVEEEFHHGRATSESMWDYLAGSEFWFESFQNWQSEFLAVVALVVLSIVLREKDSTESKDVDDPHSKTGA